MQRGGRILDVSDWSAGRIRGRVASRAAQQESAIDDYEGDSPVKITMRAASMYSINFRPSKTIEVDDEEWADMEPDERTAYMDEEIRMWRQDLVDIDWEPQN